MSGVGSQTANALRVMLRHRWAAGSQRELRLALGFFTVLRLLIALAALAVMTVLAQAVTARVIAVAAAAGTVLALIQVDRMLERARRDLAEARRATLWAEARAEQRGGASASELLVGFRLFDRWGGWLTSPGRKLARERSLALLAATFDRGGDGLGQLPAIPRRHGDLATWPGSIEGRPTAGPTRRRASTESEHATEHPLDRSSTGGPGVRKLSASDSIFYWPLGPRP